MQRRRWGSDYRHGRRELGEYEVAEHVAALLESGLTLYGYCRERGVDRRSLGEGIREHRPDLYARLVGEGGEEKGAPAGRKLEQSAKAMLERRGYYVIRSFLSQSPVDMLAVGRDRPALMVQAKKSGTIGTAD